MGPSDPHPRADLTGSQADQQDTLAPGQPGDSVAERGRASKNMPAMFGRYRIERLLGQGGMGSVYLAHDTHLHRPVALKIPKFDDETRPELVERFYREARAAAALRHPNLCPVYDVGEIDGTHYITMAFIDGQPLSNFVSAKNPKSAGQIATLLRKLAGALAEAHAHGIIHRDLKPANIMLDSRHEPIVMDFGLAWQLKQAHDPRLTQSGTLVGSPAYMSPEQLYGKREQIGPASDVYSLGVIFYELLTGRLPYEGSVSAVIAQILAHDPPRPSTLQPSIDPAAESICVKMMARPVAERFQTMAEVAAALGDYLDRRGSTSDAELPLERTTAPTTSAVTSQRPQPVPAPRTSTPPQLPRPPGSTSVQRAFGAVPARQPRPLPALNTAGAGVGMSVSDKVLLPLRLLLAIALPPLAVMSCGKWREVPLNALLTLCGWIPGMVHALLIVITPTPRNRTSQIMRRRPRDPHSAAS
jgi:serine/threonine protein kinase/uncharacterized membrane protein YqaE (UPF0057 family)